MQVISTRANSLGPFNYFLFVCCQLIRWRQDPGSDIKCIWRWCGSERFDCLLVATVLTADTIIEELHSCELVGLIHWVSSTINIT